MVLCRRFIAGTRILAGTKIHIQRQGILRPTRRFCASPAALKTPKSSHVNKSEASKERRMKAIEAFVKQYMQSHGSFPKASSVQKEVGGSWYIVKNILAEVKEKMFGDPQDQQQSTVNPSDKMVDTTTFQVMKTGESLDAAEPNESKSSLHSSEKERDPHINREVIATSSTSCIDSVKLVEDGAGSHQFQTKCSTVVATDKDRDESLKRFSLLNGLVSIKEKASTARPLGVTSSSAETSFENVECQVNKVTAYMESSEGSEGREISTGTVVAPKPLSSLVRGQLSGKVKPARALDSAGSEEEPSTEIIEVSPNHISTGITSKRISETKGRPPSNNMLKVFGLADLLTRRKMDNGEVHDDTAKQEAVSESSVKTSGDDSMKMLDIKSLINRIKKLPKDAQPHSSQANAISNKINPLKNGGFSRHKSQAAVTPGNLKLSNGNDSRNSLSRLFIDDKLQKNGQQEREMKERKETNSGTRFQHMDRVILKKSDESSTPGMNNLLHIKEEDPSQKVSFEIFDSQKESEFESKTDASINMKSKPSPNFKVTPNKPSKEKTSHTLLLTEKGREQTTLLVRFLNPLQTVEELEMTFSDCGPIDEIVFLSEQKWGRLRDAYIRFKTKKGMQTALAKTDVYFKNSEVVLEPVSPLEHKPNKIIAPNLIPDPDVPKALIKNPTQTVMIKDLPRDLTSDYLKEALIVRAGPISGFFMGSSSSVAYIEFETKDAKEKALAASPISISGREVSILRIDAPKTTVVRISNVRSLEGKTFRSLCSPYGEIQKVQRRSRRIYDVYFKLTEWANMVKILNSLNGKVVDQHRWIAQPATVIPCELLTYIWRQPDGKKEMYSTLQDIIRKFEEQPLDMRGLKCILSEYSGERA